MGDATTTSLQTQTLLVDTTPIFYRERPLDSSSLSSAYRIYCEHEAY